MPFSSTVVPARSPRPRARNTATSDTRWKRNEIMSANSRRQALGEKALEDLADLEQELLEELPHLGEEQSEGLGNGDHDDHGEQRGPHEHQDLPAPDPSPVHAGDA